MWQELLIEVIIDKYNIMEQMQSVNIFFEII